MVFLYRFVPKSRREETEYAPKTSLIDVFEQLKVRYLELNERFNLGAGFHSPDTFKNSTTWLGYVEQTIFDIATMLKISLPMLNTQDPIAREGIQSHVIDPYLGPRVKTLMEDLDMVEVFLDETKSGPQPLPGLRRVTRSSSLMANIQSYRFGLMKESEMRKQVIEEARKKGIPEDALKQLTESEFSNGIIFL